MGAVTLLELRVRWLEGWGIGALGRHAALEFGNEKAVILRHRIALNGKRIQ